MPSTSLRLLLLASIVPTHAAADSHERLHDGSVRVGEHHFATLSDYFRSPLFRESGARCGSAKDSVTARDVAFLAPTDCTLDATRISPVYDDNRVFVIQVIFHIIQKTDGTGAISAERIASQIAVLNEDFNALPGTLGARGTNARVKFVLARRDPMGRPTNGIEVITNDTYFVDPGPEAAVNPMKVALHWDPKRYLNVYTNNGGGALGYAAFPQLSFGMPGDGIILDHSIVGRNAPGAAPFDLGRTLTHEVGHWVGLLHTFQDGCGSAGVPYTSGDRIADTVPESEPAAGCTPAPSACGGGMNPIENYMDYSDDACYTRFSVEQVNRLRCSLVNYRDPNTEPRPGFDFRATDGEVTFTNKTDDDESVADKLEYRWTFGDGETSTEANPQHRYAAPGMYTVTLEVFDEDSASAKVSLPVAIEKKAAGSDEVTGGCAAGGGAAGLLVALFALLVPRRRR